MNNPDEKWTLVSSQRSAPPEGWTQDEWDVYLDGLEAQTRAAEEAAKADGTAGKKMHYGNDPWGDD